MAIEVEVLLGVCGFVVEICDALAIFIFFTRMSKNGSSLKLCSIVLFSGVGFGVSCVNL